MGIEKMGLPAKPAAKGSSWVLDASTCQSCQTAFSLFNRKHHCRRCGGLFCGNCTNSRANLRGQGDGPVRVCDPCKKLEEAARFLARRRGKPSKDDKLLEDGVGDDLATLISGGKDLLGGESDGQLDSTEASPMKGEAVESKEEKTSPEKLREQSSEQKKVYATLKREGKNAEALQAFKRHKELGREADSLELSLRKSAVSQRKSLVAAQAAALAAAQSPVQKSEEPSESVHIKENQGAVEEKLSSRASANVRKPSQDGVDDDLFKALKDLGWNEADLNEKKTKKGPASDMELLSEISDSLPKEAVSKKAQPQNPTQLEILALKRKALALKREGKPLEAKEELKKAKLLEKRLEEMAMLEDEEEDDMGDDELGALMRSLDKEAKASGGRSWASPSMDDNISLSFDVDDDDDANVDVTDDDINDPSMITALRAMGWEEEAAAMERAAEPSVPEGRHGSTSSTEVSRLQSEVLNVKRRALVLKREGKLDEAKIELQGAKVLEQKLEVLKSRQTSSDSVRSLTVGAGKPRQGPKETQQSGLLDVLQDPDDAVEVDEEDMTDPDMMAALKAMGFEEEPLVETFAKPSPREKKDLQDEILSIKRSALALKKQGKTVEAKEELKQAKNLELKLQTMQSDLEANDLPPVAVAVKEPSKGLKIPSPAFPPAGLVSEDDEDDVAVSADDFMDPELVAALKSVGWQEEDTFANGEKPKEQEEPAIVLNSPPIAVQPYKAVQLPQKDLARKSQLQKELLAHKRKALILKREGKVEEAKLELKKGNVLEKEMEEIENAALSSNEDLPEKMISQAKHSSTTLSTATVGEFEEDDEVTDSDMQDPELLDALKSFGWKPEPDSTPIANERSSKLTPATSSMPKRVETKNQIAPIVDVAKPPYSHNVTEPVDPIWYAIVNSASKKHYEVQDVVNSKENGEEDLGDQGSLTDKGHSIRDQSSSGMDGVLKGQQQVETFGLPGHVVRKPPGQNVPEDDETEKDDDVFDSDLLTAPQGIGMVPSKNTAFQMSQEDPAKVKLKTGDSKQKIVNDPLHSQRIQAVAAEESASGGQKNTKALESSNVPPGPAREVASPSNDTNALPAAPLKSTIASIQDEILVHKRKALALKREGKQSEAREELRQAKLLEKNMEKATPTDDQGSNDISTANFVHSSTHEDNSGANVLGTKSHPSPSVAQSHKEQLRQEVRQGKDRKKLQQEALAHKRKALGLRREGKTEEADAEFELAKSLEQQMEDLDTGPKPAQSDMSLVEDLLDPQLAAALQGLGLNDRELRRGNAPTPRESTQEPNSLAGKQSAGVQVSGPPAKVRQSDQPTPVAGGQISSPDRVGANVVVQDKRVANTPRTQSGSIGGRSTSGVVNRPSRQASDRGKNVLSAATNSSANDAQARRKQLEERIKREKIKALELKRGGQQLEALEILRGAKQLEKQLLSM